MFRSLDLKKIKDEQQKHTSDTSFHLRSIFEKLKTRIFKANAVLLHHQIVREPLYHVILLFEFFQIMHLVYYPVIYRDGFMP